MLPLKSYLCNLSAMRITSAQFVISSPSYQGCPKPDRPEYAFIGRSNVGKSSLINMLTGVGNLAKTSSSPGKTQLINHFSINADEWYLVDLPGYGYAKVPKVMQGKWEGMIKNYLLKRENLLCVFQLIDSRLEPQPNDLRFMQWMGSNNIPFVIVFTKVDKLSVNKTQANIELYKNEMLKTWEELPPLFVTSTASRLGKEELIQYIAQHNPLFKNTSPS